MAAVGAVAALLLEDSAVSGNAAGADGGGMAADVEGGAVDIRATRFVGNMAAGGCGGLAAVGARRVRARALPSMRNCQKLTTHPPATMTTPTHQRILPWLRAPPAALALPQVTVVGGAFERNLARGGAGGGGACVSGADPAAAFSPCVNGVPLTLRQPSGELGLVAPGARVPAVAMRCSWLLAPPAGSSAAAAGGNAGCRVELRVQSLSPLPRGTALITVADAGTVR